MTATTGPAYAAAGPRSGEDDARVAMLGDFLGEVAR